MPTFPRTRRTSDEYGTTLIELLVTLSIIALLAAMAAGASSGMISGLSLRAQSDALVSDLRRAELEASIKGETIEVAARSNGYDIARLGISRNWPDDVRADWPDESGKVSFDASGAATGGTITLRRGTRQERVTIDPILGRVRKID